MKNVLFFLTPKAMCDTLHSDHTLRKAVEIMEKSGYASLPILNKRGEYCGSLSQGDLLRALKRECDFDLRKASDIKIMDFPHRRDYKPVPVTTSMHDLVGKAAEQNFVPVIDDKGTFIGIVTRSNIMKYCMQELFSED